MAEIEQIEEDATDLILELDEKVSAIREKYEDKLDATEEKEVRLEKSDIRVDRFGVLWVPVSRRV